jgi:hypothetical protein
MPNDGGTNDGGKVDVVSGASPPAPKKPKPKSKKVGGSKSARPRRDKGAWIIVTWERVRCSDEERKQVARQIRRMVVKYVNDRRYRRASPRES